MSTHNIPFYEKLIILSQNYPPFYGKAENIPELSTENLLSGVILKILSKYS